MVLFLVLLAAVAHLAHMLIYGQEKPAIKEIPATEALAAEIRAALQKRAVWQRVLQKAAKRRGIFQIIENLAFVF